jgi:hypothetical protein
MVGPGYTNMEARDVGFSGIGFGFELALGYALAENFVLFGEIMVNGAVDPDTKAGSTMVELDDTSAFLQNYGLGAAYYIMPANIFLAASICTAKIQLSNTAGEEAETLFNTDYGFGANVSLGKEWWVGSDLGVGAALQGAYSRISDEVRGGTREWTGWGLSLVLTATVN